MSKGRTSIDAKGNIDVTDDGRTCKGHLVILHVNEFSDRRRYPQASHFTYGSRRMNSQVSWTCPLRFPSIDICPHIDVIFW